MYIDGVAKKKHELEVSSLNNTFQGRVLKVVSTPSGGVYTEIQTPLGKIYVPPHVGDKPGTTRSRFVTATGVVDSPF